MRPVEDALENLGDYPIGENNTIKDFISIYTPENSHIDRLLVEFQIQSDPISVVGVNGCQAEDMLKYLRNLFMSLNAVYPCLENAHTIDHLNQAIIWQTERTANRKIRGVEGKNEL
jgi:hypothetical protein